MAAASPLLVLCVCLLVPSCLAYYHTLWHVFDAARKAEQPMCENVGEFCGHNPNGCCGTAKCQLYNMFQRQFEMCLPGASKTECVCVASGWEHSHGQNGHGHLNGYESTTEQPYDPCHGSIPQGEACGEHPLGCCGHMECLTYAMRPCPSRSRQNDCFCMLRGAIQWNGK